MADRMFKRGDSVTYNKEYKGLGVVKENQDYPLSQFIVEFYPSLFSNDYERIRCAADEVTLLGKEDGKKLLDKMREIC